MDRNRKLVVFLAVLCLSLGSCTQTKELSKTLGALAEVRSEVIKRFGEKDVNVNLNGSSNEKTFSVTFVNSPLLLQDHTQRSQRAQQTAEIVRDRYADIKSVGYIVVAFSEVKTFLGIFHSNMVVDVLWFDHDAQPHKDNDNQSGVGSTTPVDDPLEPKVSYSSTRNETEIYLEGVLLEGEPEKGLTMVPRISVKGKTNIRTPEAPDSMHFDFASFSDKPQFPGVTKIKFIADKNYEFEGQFSTSRSNDGLVSEFLYLEVPYSNYRQIANSPSVTVILGKKKFELTGQQIHALNRLTTFVKANP